MKDHSTKFEVLTKNGLSATQETQILHSIQSIVPDHILVRVLPNPIPMKQTGKAIHHLDGNPQNNDIANLKFV